MKASSSAEEALARLTKKTVRQSECRSTVMSHAILILNEADAVIRVIEK
jgi:hypothetical protein